MTPISSRLSVPFRLGPVALFAGGAAWLVYRLSQSDGWGRWFAEHWWMMLMLAMAAILHRFAFWHLADEVMDCGDHLRVRRERRVMLIPLSEIEGVREGSCLICGDSGPGSFEAIFGTRKEIILRLSRASDWGRTIHFMAADSRLPFTHKRVGLVHHLKLRIERAKGAGTTSRTER